MFRLLGGVLLFLNYNTVKGVKFFPADYGGGLGYGEKYTNVEYGPGVYGYRQGFAGNYGYKDGLPYEYKDGLPYGDGVVGLPRAAGYAYGGELDGVGYKGINYAPVGSIQQVGIIPKPVGIGYGSELQHYPTVGITKGIAPIYSPITSGYGSGLGHSYYGTPGLIGHGKYLGGSAVDQNVYSTGNKNIADEQYLKSHGVNNAELNHGDAGYSRGNVAVKDVKGDSVHFVDTNGEKLEQHAGKDYHGGEHFGKEGKHGTEQVSKEGFKKGHNVKSFKKSHHLDETGKTEEFYDESHDEGGNYAFDGQSGLFGEKGASSFKGGHDDGKYTSGETKKEGHYDNEHIVDKAQADHGKYGGNKYAQNEEIFGNHKGIGESGLSGHHEASNFYKKFPHYY